MGTNGFTTPFCKMDVRPGGVTHFCMRSPGGRDYWGRWVYREVVPPERIVFTDTFADEEGNPAEPARYGMPDWPFETLVTVTLAEDQGKTKLTLHHAVALSLAESTGAMQGWNEALDRLAAELVQVLSRPRTSRESNDAAPNRVARGMAGRTEGASQEREGAHPHA